MNTAPQVGIFSIATLERFNAPPELDGKHGRNRLNHGIKSILADNDVDAIKEWLLTHDHLAHATVGVYRNAAEKVLNWSCFVQGKALSSLDDMDINSFLEFLAAPTPSLDWIDRTAGARSAPEWRPFRGPLSLASVRQVMFALSTLFNWMGRVGYAAMPQIAENRAVRAGTARHGIAANISAVTMRRTLSIKAWDRISEVLTSGVDFRARLALELIYFGNLKVAEIRKLKIADFVAPSIECIAWRCQVDSMRNFLRCIYLLPPLGRSLSQLFETRLESPSVSLTPRDVRLGSELLFKDADWPAGCIKKIMRLAASLAEEQGDAQCAIELRSANLTSFRGAFESHVGGDRAFILGFIAHAFGSGSLIAEYTRVIVLNNDFIASGWKRLDPHWSSYTKCLALVSNA